MTEQTWYCALYTTSSRTCSNRGNCSPTIPRTREGLGRCSGQGPSTHMNLALTASPLQSVGGRELWVIANLHFNSQIQIKPKVVIKDEDQSDSTLPEKKRLKKVNGTQF